MPLFSASSRQRITQNQDGSWNVYCSNCREFISRTNVRIERAQCELCRRVEAGETLSEEAIRLYKLSKAERVDVTYLALDEPDIRAVGIKKKYTFGSVTGEILSALGRFAASVQGKPSDAEKAMSQSVQVAQQKKRKRLFSNIDLSADATQLGSMEELDAKTRNK